MAKVVDVARLANVSVGSVSRVLNNAPDVSERVKSSVEAAIRKLNYKPNHLARSLRTKRSWAIGCLFSEVTNPLYARVFNILESELRSDGYSLFLAQGLGDVKKEVESLRLFESRGIDGIIYAPANEQSHEVRETLAEMETPVLLFDRSVKGLTTVDRVLFDHRGGMIKACEVLFAANHKNTLLALWDANSRPVVERITAYRSMNDVEGSGRCGRVLLADSSMGTIYEEMLAALDGEAAPTAIIVQGTRILMSAIAAIKDSGRRIPEDISLISIGDSDFAQYNRPTITSLRVDFGELVNKIKALLLDKIGTKEKSGERDGAREEIVAYELILRKSVMEKYGAI